MEGVARADSWATDAHKWLNVPQDSGIAIVRDAEALGRSMSIAAAYYPPDADGKRQPMQLGLNLRVALGQLKSGRHCVPSGNKVWPTSSTVAVNMPQHSQMPLAPEGMKFLTTLC